MIPFMITWALAAGIQMLAPLAIAWWFARRYRVGVLPFAFGVAVFFGFQMMTRIPAVQVLGQTLAPWLRGQPGRQVLYLGFLAFTAGLFESVGRWVGYRYLFPNRLPYTWAQGVAYGIGHGGIESALLIGFNQAASWALIVLMLLVGRDLSAAWLPAPLTAQLEAGIAQIAALPWYATLWGALERLLTMVFHAALSLVVLQGFIRGQARWLWIAVGIHGLVDFVVPGTLHLWGWPIWATEMLLAVVSLAALWLIRYWRPAPPVAAEGEG